MFAFTNTLFSREILTIILPADNTSLDIGQNAFTGSLPDGIGQMTNLQRFSAPQNRFIGKFPPDMNRMKPNLDLNLTGNL